LVPLACGLATGDTIRATLSTLAARPPEPKRRGTLLLGDADQLPAEAQADLAAILAAKRFPLRTVATAQRALLDLARQGAYREDLAALLSTLVIELPALAQRRADLPLLVQLFVEEANARSGKQVAGLTAEAMTWLDGYSWPGNVDELIYVIIEAHERAEGREISIGDLPERIRLAREAAAHPRRAEPTIVLDEFLARIERELVQRAIERAKGNKTKAARLLGMNRPKFYRRLVQLGMENEIEKGKGSS
jgi:DNA-binding NtrC family response regulator